MTNYNSTEKQAIFISGFAAGYRLRESEIVQAKYQRIDNIQPIEECVIIEAIGDTISEVFRMNKTIEKRFDRFDDKLDKLLSKTGDIQADIRENKTEIKNINNKLDRKVSNKSAIIIAGIAALLGAIMTFVAQYLLSLIDKS